jgi:type III secretory pathway component EscT
MELIVRVLPMFVFLPIVMSSGSGGAARCMGVAVSVGNQGAFFNFARKSFSLGSFTRG